ncbi:acetamidase/formamidase family protein [Cellulomonas endophytica]|uniref:acetamidase/formamidase family protein n=1 Tax=Cellulomonas endophytica TaxID=2494735 RepID=UPI0010113EE2|nr:acetamidase/formamidase family protein [Cellulomonas endophytica]
MSAAARPALVDPGLPVLQPGAGVPEGVAYLASGPRTVLWGRLPCAVDAPVAHLRAGDELVVDTLSHEGLLEDQGGDPRAWFGAQGVPADNVLDDAVAVAAGLSRDPDHDGPHVVTGPVHVAGAHPGDLLAVTVLETVPRVPYGVVSNRHRRGALPDELPRGERSVSVFTPVLRRADGALVGALPLVDGGERVVAFPLAPFLGIVGVAVADDERPHSVPPGPHGGNIDVNLLVAGTAVYLPVQVEGAGLYVGDPHFAQGDGEVALTALEASLRVRLRVDVVPRAQALTALGELDGPVLRTPEHLVPTGLDVDLDEALRRCVRAALRLLGARYGMAEHLAYAYLSAATDFDVSQVVDVVTGVHARIRLADFAGVGPGEEPPPVLRPDGTVGAPGALHGSGAPDGSGAPGGSATVGGAA